jgi:glutamate-5-semialdehyde dehydrogenase
LQLCREQSTIPVITGGIGVCHIYIDDSADVAEALKLSLTPSAAPERL